MRTYRIAAISDDGISSDVIAACAKRDGGGVLMRAIERITADRSLHTPDLGRTATTANVTRAVSDALAGDNQA
jgi:isocitrate/isopropylmalate dehydrogenase